MRVIGCDYHRVCSTLHGSIARPESAAKASWAQREKAENFYRDLQAKGVSVRVGIEAGGHARWFERLLRARARRRLSGCVVDHAALCGRGALTFLEAACSIWGTIAAVLIPAAFFLSVGSLQGRSPRAC
jgi:hypothetical protein